MKKNLSAWGLYPRHLAKLVTPSSQEALLERFEENKMGIARGNGRSYGDSSLSDVVYSCLQLSRLLSFDPETAILRCESGVLFSDIIKVFAPRGFFVPVTSGTKLVTVGGAIASDIHGKNHHAAGSMSSHVLALKVLLANGKVRELKRGKDDKLLQAFCGSMGSLGIILEAEIRLMRIPSIWVKQESIACPNLDALIEVMHESENWTHTMAWIDLVSGGKSLGRGIMQRGEFAEPEELPKSLAKNPLKVPEKKKLSVPFLFPGFALNKISVGAFNFLYYNKHVPKKKQFIGHYDSFFYPLDAIHNWNRIYGKKGFTQYQPVIPGKNAHRVVRKIIEKVQQSGQASFLAVFKRFGSQNDIISFPSEGYTLTLDFQIKPSLFPLLDELDKLVLEAGGRLYLTKDVRMNADFFKKTYPHHKAFLKLKKKWDPENRFQSLQTRRLEIKA